MNHLYDKIALISGGAQGIGAAMAEKFVAAGATVVITDIDGQAGAVTAARVGPDCTFIRQDVTLEADWARVIASIEGEFGKIDVLVNNAGIFSVASLEATGLQLWDRMIAVNQTSVFLGLRTVAPVMKRQSSGSIVNLSSIAGLSANPGGRAHAYAATKWAVRGMTKSAAVELAPFGIRVNSVHPGLIDTRMIDLTDSAPEELDARVPLGRRGTVEEVAKMVLFLASDDSSHCSGHEFVVDGAMRA